MRVPKLLAIKPGATESFISDRHGDFDRWFARAVGDAATLDIVEIHRGDAIPDFRGWDGVIVTGSPLSMTAPTPWMLDGARRLREHAEAGGALLGVCFGHQMLSHAFGKPVIRNPRGREIGTISVQLTPEGRADPLFDGLGPDLRVLATHTDAASAVPEGTTLLASNERCAVQALAAGPRARSVQFHPEADAATIRSLIELRTPAMTSEGLDPAAHAASTVDTPDGQRILLNFLKFFVEG